MSKDANTKTRELMERLNARGIKADFAQAETLRRAELVLSRWGELECGDGNDFQSWSIERDEVTGKPYMAHYPHQGKSYREPIADRERGALKRVAAVCKELGCYYFHQTDPRGCALYVSAEPIKDNDYTRGVACCS